MAKLTLIANPLARKNRTKRGWLDKQRKLIARYDNAAFVETHSLEHLQEVLPEIATNNEVVAISGGDGSVHAVLTYLLREKIPFPRIHYVPGGTMNMLGTTTKPITRKGLAGLEDCLKKSADQLESIKRDTLVINDRYAGFMFGTGLVANFLRAYYEMGGNGSSDAVRLIGRFAWSVARTSELAKQMAAPENASFKLDGQSLKYKQSTAVIVQTIANLGVGFKPMYQAEHNDGHFHTLIADMPIAQLFNRIQYIYKGRPWNYPRVCDEIGQELLIHFDRDSHMQVDGEIYETGAQISVRVGQPVVFV